MELCLLYVFSLPISLCGKKTSRAQFGKVTKCCFASLPGGYFEVPAVRMKVNHLQPCLRDCLSPSCWAHMVLSLWEWIRMCQIPNLGGKLHTF